MKESSNQGFQINSKFQTVIAAAKRSKQISSEAKKRGLSPNEVALVRTNFVKSTTLALAELKAGKLRVVKSNNAPDNRNKSVTGEITATQPFYSEEQDISSEEQDISSEEQDISSLESSESDRESSEDQC
jgi:DNA-directed RNA polymerase omega subunit